VVNYIISKKKKEKKRKESLQYRVKFDVYKAMHRDIFL